MKSLKLSTTTKLYLLTLLLIFGIIFLNQSVFAQSQTSSTTQKRLKIMERYLSWIETNQYGEFKDEQGKLVFEDFKTFLSKAASENRVCLARLANIPSNNLPKDPTFIENIQTFFSGLVGGTQSSITTQTSQPSNCTVKIRDDYKLAKKYNRALKYLQIQAGQPNVCVKADLGVGTAIKARGFNPTKAPLRQPADGGSDNPKETGVSEPLQVYLCTGNDGKKKVRVVDNSGTRLRLAPEDAAKSKFKVENLPPKGSYEALAQKLGL